MYKFKYDENVSSFVETWLLSRSPTTEFNSRAQVCSTVCEDVLRATTVVSHSHYPS